MEFALCVILSAAKDLARSASRFNTSALVAPAFVESAVWAGALESTYSGVC